MNDTSKTKDKLNKPKEAYVQRTLRFLKNAMRNVLKEYYTEANNNLKEKHELELPTKEKFETMYNKLTTYNKSKTSQFKMTVNEIKDLWNTAKTEITSEVKRLGQDGHDFDKQLASDGLSLVPEMDGLDGIESITFSGKEVYMSMDLSLSTIQKLDFMFSNLENIDFVSWYMQSGKLFLMQFIKNDMAFKDTNYNMYSTQICDQPVNNFGLSYTIDIDHKIKQQIQDLLLRIDREKTTEQETFILQIDEIINRIVAQYYIAKNSTDRQLNPVLDNSIIRELSLIVGEECAINIYILFYFDMLSQDHINDIDSIIKLNLKI